MIQSLWLTTPLMSDAWSSGGCRVLKSCLASTCRYLGAKTFKAGERLAAVRATKEVWTKWSLSCKCHGVLACLCGGLVPHSDTGCKTTTLAMPLFHWGLVKNESSFIIVRIFLWCVRGMYAWESLDWARDVILVVTLPLKLAMKPATIAGPSF